MIASTTGFVCLVNITEHCGTNMNDDGKGHTQRPRSIADEEWAERWNAIFGKDRYDDFKLSKDIPKETKEQPQKQQE